MNRRTFLAGAVGAASAACAVADDELPFPIIDTHIHIYDPTRPQGVPWPPKDNPVLYKPALPERYRKLVANLGVRAAIAVECSPWLEDNQWILDRAISEFAIVGMIGNLEPGKPEFAKQLERFQRNPLFRGIRYGNLWGRNLSAELAKPAFIADLKLLANAGLTLDTADPDPALVEAVVRLTDQVPALAVVIDHLPQLDPPTGKAALDAYRANLRELGKRPQVYCKFSQVLRRVNGKVPEDLRFYQPRLDELFGIFGENRVLYGSDWPNCDQWADYPVVLKLVRDYFTGKGMKIAEKYFFHNSTAAYGWVKRDYRQSIRAR